jgi:hypothetical protein
MTDYNDPKVKKAIIKKVLDERALRDKGVIILNDYRYRNTKQKNEI